MQQNILNYNCYLCKIKSRPHIVYEPKMMYSEAGENCARYYSSGIHAVIVSYLPFGCRPNDNNF
jgi:hypothetical protein